MVGYRKYDNIAPRRDCRQIVRTIPARHELSAFARGTPLPADDGHDSVSGLAQENRKRRADVSGTDDTDIKASSSGLHLVHSCRQTGRFFGKYCGEIPYNGIFITRDVS